MPVNDEYTTSYAPGDLFDLLSTSNETRFHAGHLFMRYFRLISCADADEESEALEAVTWDLAVACLALSVKVHLPLLPFPRPPSSSRDLYMHGSSTATSCSRST